MARSCHPQAGMMFAKLAAHHSDNLGKVEDEFYDFSNADKTPPTLCPHAG
jgi:hypothetical protein